MVYQTPDKTQALDTQAVVRALLDEPLDLLLLPVVMARPATFISVFEQATIDDKLPRAWPARWRENSFRRLVLRPMPLAWWSKCCSMANLLV